mgnify:FL=1
MLANILRRNTLQLVAVIFGAVQAVVLLIVAIIGLWVASAGPPAAIQAVMVAGGSALVLGWLVVPLLLDGAESTLDATRLARFPLRRGTFMWAVVVAAVLWVPGATTLLVSLASAIAWREHPLAAGAAIVVGMVGTATCIVGSRLVTTTASAMVRGGLSSRIAVPVLLLVVTAAPIAAVVAGAVAGAGQSPLDGFAVVVDVLGWTPVGAIWSVPGRMAMGDAAGAAGAAAIALAVLAGALVLWWGALGARAPGLIPRLGRSGRTGLGPFRWMPASPAGAIAARSIIMWFRDPRLARQLILLVLLPALMLVWWWLFDLDVIALGITPIVATILPLAVFAGLSYDGPAFAMQLAAGVRGRDDRMGRAAALLLIAGPAVVIVQVVVAVVIDRAGELPAMFGLSLGVLLASIGVVSVSSARVVVPVARSARNPFSAPPGSATTSLVASYAVSGATILVSAPAIALAVAALVTGSDALGWVALVVGVLAGGVVLVAGVVVGGRVLDESGPAVLQRLRLVRG